MQAAQLPEHMLYNNRLTSESSYHKQLTEQAVLKDSKLSSEHNSNKQLTESAVLKDNKLTSEQLPQTIN